MGSRLVQKIIDIIGSPDEPATLTDAYAAGLNGIGNLASAEEAVLLVGYAMGAAETSNSIQFKITYGDGEDRFYTPVSNSNQTLSKLAEYTFSAAAAAEAFDELHIPIRTDAKVVKIELKETGVASVAGSVYVRLLTKSQA